MTEGVLGPRRPRGARPRRRLLPFLIAVPVLLVVLFGPFASLFTDVLWYREVGFSTVFSTQVRARIVLFLIFGLLMAGVVVLNLYVAYRLRPPFTPGSLEQRRLEGYRAFVRPRRWLVWSGIAVFFGLVTGLAHQTRWTLWLGWRNQVPFGVKDAQFDRDLSYFAFTYPMQRSVLSFCFAAVAVAIVVSAASHYLWGGIRIQTAGEKVVASARAHLSVLLGLFVLLKGVAYWLDAYGLAFSTRGVVQTGASYADVTARLPALRILTVIAVISAGLFVYNLRSRGWSLPALGFGLMVLSSIVVGGLYPAIVQQLRVRPNELAREAPYIQRNIDATRYAYGLRDVVTTQYAARTTPDVAALKADTATVPNARLLDPNVLKQTFEQLQGLKAYYRFADTLDIDRYTVAGKTQDYVVGVRELDQSGLAAAQRNFLNDHLVYTHGFGVVAAPANAVDSDGRPVFSLKDIPQAGPVPLTQPRIYFGEGSPTYSVVRTEQEELDRPQATGDGLVTNRYDGTGGVRISGLWRRLVFAMRFRERNLLLSGALTSESRILYARNPRSRVKRVAPWLTLDQDPYPAVVNGRVLWIVDGYTTTAGVPYAERLGFGDVTRDSQGRLQAQQSITYIRNAVKATVDAYDGSVTLYAWDEADPVLRTWMRAFPGTVKPRASMPADVVAHLRYPEDLFKVQRELLSRYHVTEARAFYSGEDFWDVPSDPTVKGSKQPPFYVLSQVPGQNRANFNLTSPLVARNKANLAAYMSVSSDQSDYGVIRVLQLPRDTTISGPGQVENRFESTPAVSRDLSLLRSGGSTVTLGNLLSLPVGGGLIYVQPIFVQSTGGSSFPQLRKVLVSVGEKVGYGDTFAEALTQVFGVTVTPSEPAGPGPAPGGSDLAQAIADAQKAYTDGVAALARGDFAAYGEAQRRLKAALDRAAAASRSPSPSPSPSG